MATPQELAEHGLRQPGDGEVVDLCEHLPTAALYVIRWSEASGQMLAIHGPVMPEDLPTLDIQRLSWTADHDLAWAIGQQWRQLEVLSEEGF